MLNSPLSHPFGKAIPGSADYKVWNSRSVTVVQLNSKARWHLSKIKQATVTCLAEGGCQPSSIRPPKISQIVHQPFQSPSTVGISNHIHFPQSQPRAKRILQSMNAMVRINPEETRELMTDQSKTPASRIEVQLATKRICSFPPCTMACSALLWFSMSNFEAPMKAKCQPTPSRYRQP